MEERADLGALSPEQQDKLRQFKIKTRMANEMYLRAHPEVDALLSDFLRSRRRSSLYRDVFLKRPADIREFAAGYFSDPDLQTKIQARMEGNAEVDI